MLMAWRIVICWGGVNVGGIKVEKVSSRDDFGRGGTFLHGMWCKEQGSRSSREFSENTYFIFIGSKCHAGGSFFFATCFFIINQV